MTTPHLKKSIDRSPLRLGFLLIGLALALAWFALSPPAHAVTPAPDGGYPNQNTAEGDSALFSLTTGTDNTAIGFDALYSNTGVYGSWNTAVGSQALFSNTGGSSNTASGYVALHSNTTGGVNTANGAAALYSNTTGSFNTATGEDALYRNTTGYYNTANGSGAWNRTQLASRTRPAVISRSLPTRLVGPTWPTGFRRSIATQPASRTRPTVLGIHPFR